MQKFTVIAIDDVTGQIVSHSVYAEEPLNAFASAAAMNSNLTLVVALPGWQEEDKGTFFPGTAPVDSDTALGQPNVFGSPLCSVTETEVVEVLRAYSLRVSNTQGKSFEEMATEVFEELDIEDIISTAFEKLSEGAGAAECQTAVFELIHAALVSKGIIEF